MCVTSLSRWLGYSIAFHSDVAEFIAEFSAIQELFCSRKPTYPDGCRSFRIQVDSHTSRSFRRHDLRGFAYIEHYSRWLITRATTFFLNITRVDKKWSSNS